MLKLFRLNQPLLAYLYFPLILVFLIPSFLAENQVIFTNIPFLNSSIFEKNILGSYLLAFFLIGLNSFLINNLSNTFLRNGDKNYLPGFFYIFFTCFSLYWFPTFDHLLAVPFLIFSLNYLLKINSQKNVLDLCFKAGFWLGIASLFDFNLIYLGVFYPISLIFSRKSSFREWLAMAIGLGIPFFISFMIFDIYNGFNDSLNIALTEVNIIPILSRNNLFYNCFLVFFLILLILSCKSFFKAFSNAVRNDKISKKTFLFVITGLIIIVVLDSFITKGFGEINDSFYYLGFILVLIIPTIFKLFRKEKWIVLILNLYLYSTIIFVIIDYLGLITTLP